jgi:hypothetical protein
LRRRRSMGFQLMMSLTSRMMTLDLTPLSSSPSPTSPLSSLLRVLALGNKSPSEQRRSNQKNCCSGRAIGNLPSVSLSTTPIRKTQSSKSSRRLSKYMTVRASLTTSPRSTDDHGQSVRDNKPFKSLKRVSRSN